MFNLEKVLALCASYLLRWLPESASTPTCSFFFLESLPAKILACALNHFSLTDRTWASLLSAILLLLSLKGSQIRFACIIATG